jgi:prepilin-type N-terminal cleavage/methylation domain-containing protein
MQSLDSILFCERLEGGHRRAFTLMELAVVIAVVAVLGALAIRAHGRAGDSGHAIVCAHNLKQLMAGYLMYAQDNHDLALAPTAWCSGILTSPPEAIDEELVRKSPTFRYVSSTSTFRCPSDASRLLYAGKWRPRNRSYSVNIFMGSPSSWTAPNSDILKPAIKLSDITSPGPLAVYVLIDEHENSINDSHFMPFADLHQFANQRWLDAPAGRHGNAGGLGYADGHSDIHRWRDSDVQGIRGSANIPVYAPPSLAGPRDFAWFTNHIAAFAR